MTHFEPLCPSAAPTAEAHRFRATILPAASTETFGAPRFAPATPATHTHETLDTSKAAQPKVTLRREGDRITHIQIECGCGQIIDLECSY